MEKCEKFVHYFTRNIIITIIIIKYILVCIVYIIIYEIRTLEE